MKVLFLDIDGVLNSKRYDATRSMTDSANIDESRLLLVREIIDRTGALIVLSSTWRDHLYDNCRPRDGVGTRLLLTFEKYSLKIAYVTPILKAPATRPREISAWLEAHKREVDSFAIIDDAFGGWGQLSERLVRTSYDIGYGLEKRHVEAAVTILNGEKS